MFYVNLQHEEKHSEHSEHSDSNENNKPEQEDRQNYNNNQESPPESPRPAMNDASAPEQALCAPAGSDPLSRKSSSSPDPGAAPLPAGVGGLAAQHHPIFATCGDLKPPVPPPRSRGRRRGPSPNNKLERLKISHNPMIRSNSQGDDPSRVSDLLQQATAYDPPKDQQQSLKGHLSMLVISAKGLRQMMKVRWFVYDSKLGRLKYFRNEDETELLGEIDIHSATFCYDVQSDRGGEFTICARQGEHVLSAGNADRRMYWLQQLQRARREYAQRAITNRNSINTSQVGLLKEKTPEDTASSSEGLGTHPATKDSSPFKDIMQTIERPPPLVPDFSSPPKSADYVKTKTSFFQSFTRNKPNFRMPRSASMRTPSPPPGVEQRSPPPSKPLSSPSTSFTALSKIRKSLRDKNRIGASGLMSPSSAAHTPWSPKRFGPTDEKDKELVALREDLQASKDEASASKEAIGILRKQIETMEKEKETFTSLLSSQVDDQHLLEILRTKDSQLLDLEVQCRDHTRVVELQESQLSKMKQELETYQQMLEAKDNAVVRLTNQLHEMELANAVAVAAAAAGPAQDSPGPKSGVGKLTSNGISFDSDRFEFKEFVDVAAQTEFDKDREALTDAVTAYEMQNKFLNKELLELNELRQQAQDREQKLFISSSDWEAKFYQIQSKYLLLLNELHNPQVSISASRKEMVSQLLKDVVDASDRPQLNNSSEIYDRFGFRLTEEEDKVERLRKQAEDKAEASTAAGAAVSAGEGEKSSELFWEETISSLNGKVPFHMTSDIKKSLRQGIPISQRGAVWKAIVDHKLMRASNEQFERDYYQKLLSNYNPNRNLSTAAKQIELDLLRTLPNNRYYDRPYADGIAKLRRVLLAYSVHNPEVEYCQGFNRIVAIALLFMNEEDAFWLLAYIIEHLMPPEYYSRDKQLIGAQVDQEVLKELVSEKLPRLAAHFERHGIDSGLFSLNWFLCVFVDNIPVSTYLHIWDSFLFEGSKVLFRYALAIFKYLEDELLRQTEYMTIFNTLRKEVEKLVDVKRLTQIAFHELNPFPMRSINNKREQHYKLLEAQKRELDHIRQNYRKSSLARSSPNSLPGGAPGNANPMVFFSSETGGGPGGGGLGGSDDDEEEIQEEEEDIDACFAEAEKKTKT